MGCQISACISIVLVRIAGPSQKHQGLFRERQSVCEGVLEGVSDGVLEVVLEVVLEGVLGVCEWMC